MFLSWQKRPWSTGATLECDISYGINAPISFVGPVLARIPAVATSRAGWFIVSFGFYFVLVFLLWHAVALKVGEPGKSSLLTLLIRHKAIRRVIDALLVVFGLFLTFLSAMNFSHAFMNEAWHKEIPIVVGGLLWGLVIASFYAKNLYLETRAIFRR